MPSGDRRLELVRDGLGLVRYHLGSRSASHEYYMKELGAWPRCDYPGFPNDPINPFERLAHDLKFAGEFVSGDARLLLRASETERTALGQTRRMRMARQNCFLIRGTRNERRIA